MSFILLLWLLGVSMAASILCVTSRWQRFERIGAELAAGLLLASLPFVWIAFRDLPLLLLAAVTHIWLLVLPARLLVGRLERPFLRGNTWQNALLGLFVLIIIALFEWWRPVYLGELGLTLWLTASLGVATFFFGQLWRNTRRYRLTPAEQPLPLNQLPTVSVCIPARNEDHALAECLVAVLASDYPKLEVLVLDDCSQDATSSIIRSFAHEGVRFIQGEPPAAGWLGKNQALHALAQQASGDYIFFMSVDTHVAPRSITDVVGYMMGSRVSMISVLPQNRLGSGVATIYNTLEYYWRLVLPITRRRTPVSSKAWCIAAHSLHMMGGFAANKRKIVPEESFAVQLAAKNKYRFLVSNEVLAITTAKRWSSQIETSMRVAYPRLRRQPMWVYGVCSVILALFVAPFIIVVSCLLSGYVGIGFWLACAASALLVADYIVVLRQVQPKSWVAACMAWPLVCLQEVGIFIASMVQYEFGEVIWKGRNVCYPVVAPAFRFEREQHRSQEQTASTE